MKRLFLKSLALAAMLASVGLLAGGCERENTGKKENGGDSVLPLRKVSGQKGRISSVDPGKQAKLQKRKRLTYVATINPLDDRKDWIWSASSVTVSPDNDAESNIVYVTWHSNFQASDPATVWGGALDVIDMNRKELVNTYESTEAKFNHALVDGNRLFLSATHAKLGGAVARVNLNVEGDAASTEADNIGFPGASVNAVAYRNGKLLAVSGYNKGTYAEFDPNVKAQAYNYVNDKNNVITPKTETIGVFGGKYAVATDDNAYVLYDAEGGARIVDMDGKETNVGVRLTSAKKKIEFYDDETKTWTVTGDEQNYYGKHTMAVTGDYAYVACGNNGLKGLNLETGAEIYTNGTMTVGLHVYGNRLFAATAQGLRIYTIEESGDLTLYAFEVESYDETTGEPTSDYPATIETAKRHSPNFVTYDPASGYIYVAYGQSGVRVYRFTPEDGDTPAEEGIDMGGNILWASEDLEGYYAWGEIFNIGDEAGKTLEYNGSTYTNDGSYYTFANSGKTSYADYTNYRFFDGTAKLTKYTWLAKDVAESEDGKTGLDPEDDAAAVRLGKGWRMPTAEEWTELVQDCRKNGSIEEVTQDGSTVLCLTAANGNKLVLPRTGYYNYRNELSGMTQYRYWSSSLSKQTNRNDDRQNVPGGFISGGSLERAWCTESLACGFSAEYYYGALQVEMTGAGELNGFDRCYGMKIRPVKDK
ncbi:MAG: hypothetical protein NC048_03085 [Bacteroides sp.]|nr:hypothetical protein [Ruminococcus flavefaciens]MCM1554461.1 hypothetical protein [Bacteroides sp.]